MEVTKILNTENIVAGYTTACEGHFPYCHPENVANYEAVGAVFGLHVERMVRANEGHTDRILVATEENGGEGILRKGSPGGADGLLTDVRGLLLCIYTADCVPVFLYDEENGIAGLVHSGRAGTYMEISVRALEAMEEQYGSRPESIRCILGPYLCAAHHEVNLCDCEPFNSHYTEEEQKEFISLRKEKAYIDMGGAIRISLERRGIPSANIQDLGICTYEDPKLYSWRRDHNPDAGILSFILLKQREA